MFVFNVNVYTFDSTKTKTKNKMKDTKLNDALEALFIGLILYLLLFYIAPFFQNL